MTDAQPSNVSLVKVLGVLVLGCTAVSACLWGSGTLSPRRPPQRRPAGSAPAPTPASVPTPQPLPEQVLASLDAGATVPANDVRVTRIRYLLGQIESKTTSNREQIASVTMEARNRLRDHYGREVSHLNLLEGGNRMLEGVSPRPFGDVMALLVVALGQ